MLQGKKVCVSGTIREYRGKPEIVLTKPKPAHAMKTIGRLFSAAIDRADYLWTLARLSVLGWLAPLPETPVDRAIREEGERLRKAFPTIDFDNPGPRRSPTTDARSR